MKKNDIIEIEITGTTSEGCGVGRYENLVVFVPYCIVGERVQVKVLKVTKSIVYAKLHEIILSSQSRIDPDCEVYKKCGGCSYLHVKYETELEIKLKHINDCLKKFSGTEAQCKQVEPAPQIERYRNKALYPVTEENGEIKIGFYTKNSHRVAECSDCKLHPVIFGKIVGVFKEYLISQKVPVYQEQQHKGLVKHLYIRKAQQGDVMVCVSINGETLPHSEILVNNLKEICTLNSLIVNINKEKTNVALGKKSFTLFGEKNLITEFNGLKFSVAPNSFFQINYSQAKNVVNEVTKQVPVGSTVIDMYCGTGSIGMCVAGKAEKVIGIEVVSAAIANAKINAELNNINNIEFICADANDGAKALQKSGVHADVVILDPPRKGCASEVIDIIGKLMRPHKIIYVSCNPATLARDIKLFTQKGYVVAHCTAFDMFPRTPHVECMVVLNRLPY